MTEGRCDTRGATTLGQLTRPVSLMATGCMPEKGAPYFCGANLFAAKKDRGLRPMAVCETFHWLTSKSLAFMVADEVAALLMPTVWHGSAEGPKAFVYVIRVTLQDASIPQG